MKRNHRYRVIAIGLAGGLLALWLWQGGAARAQEKGKKAPTGVKAGQTSSPELKLKGEELGHFLIRIKEGEGLIPRQVTVKPGTTVIWLNGTTGEYIEIGFTGDQKVNLACKAPVHFVVGPDGAYTSDKIPFGSVASLCFIEKGQFKYTVSKLSFFRSGEVPAEKLEGTVIVK
ncbi:MAG: hypothetical protein HYS70_05880 [Nitrospinae bacterium]|nr:hypothetical protein [Nitrospinota bacterium]